MHSVAVQNAENWVVWGVSVSLKIIGNVAIR